MVCFSKSYIFSLSTFFSGEIVIRCVCITNYILIGLEDVLYNPNTYLYN